MDNLRKDILHTIRRSRLPPHTAAETTSPQCRHRVKSSRSFTPPRLTSSAGSAALLSTDDLDDLKCDIVASLRNEIRQVALEMAGVAATPKMAGETNSAAAMAPPTGSELYQTRLYTELWRCRCWCQCYIKRHWFTTKVQNEWGVLCKRTMESV